MKYEGDSDANCRWCTWNDPQRIGKGTRKLPIQRTSRDHSNNCITNIGQNIEKSKENLRRLALDQILVKNY